MKLKKNIRIITPKPQRVLLRYRRGFAPIPAVELRQYPLHVFKNTRAGISKIPYNQLITVS